MEAIHEGGCVCGAVRFRAIGQPRRVSLCSCSWCRKRTGSLIGVSVYFDKNNVQFINAELKTHQLLSDAGRWVECQFCEHCGSALTWTLEFLPEYRGIAGGAFDAPMFIQPERYVYYQNKPEWLEINGDIRRCPLMPESPSH
ncbi:GFA family protein [Microbulbifer sp. THAF38]|uniref:GFA family protein n=1 Tax=Microbulbifer sp. THAF38 TaxID=2587856 RepID=UPI0012690D8C|nr:GFA family protein [Microbulbifer sp. THAF38]QFT56265.1 Glutathione-dependent formaldehyde-activating enzyme [Microbulbifer sp. THAF38]